MAASSQPHELRDTRIIKRREETCPGRAGAEDGAGHLVPTGHPARSEKGRLREAGRRWAGGRPPPWAAGQAPGSLGRWGSVGEHEVAGGTSGAEAPPCLVGKQSLPFGLFLCHLTREKWVPVCFGSQKNSRDVGEGCSGAEGGTSRLLKVTVSKHILSFPPYK